MVLRVNSASDPGLTLKVSITSQLGGDDAEGPFLSADPSPCSGDTGQAQRPRRTEPSQVRDRSLIPCEAVPAWPQSLAAWPGVPDRLCTCLTLWGGSSRQGPHLGSQGWQGRRDPQALQRSWAGARSQLRVQRTLVKG